MYTGGVLLLMQLNRRQALLGLALLILSWGVLLIGVSLLLSFLGLGGGMPATDAASAFRLALGNGLVLIFTFGVSTILVLPFWKDAWGSAPLGFASISPAVWGWIALLMLGLQPVLPWFSLDADSFQLPPAWKDQEIALEATEAHIETIMLSLLTHGALFWNLIFLAVVPGIIEELFFRGAFQGLFSHVTHPIAAIWITAFVFSAVHGQVYGFIPRMLLGALMGYLMLYSRSLLPAMWAHFLNNAYATLTGYVAIHFLSEPEFVKSTYRPPVWIALVGAAVAGAAAYQTYRLLRRHG